MLGDNPTFTPTVFVCSHDYATVVIMFYSFRFNKVPSKALGIVWIIVDLILFKNRNLCAQWQNCLKLLERRKILNFLQLIYIQISYVFLFVQNFWSYRSMESFQITTEYSIFDRFCFHCVVCLMNLWVVSEGMNHVKDEIQLI